MAEQRKTTGRPAKASVHLTSENSEGSGDVTHLLRFVEEQVEPVSQAFARTPLHRLRVKTAQGAITLVKSVAERGDSASEPPAEAPRQHDRPAHGARIHNPETGRAYDTISAGVVGIFRELPEPPSTGERLTAGQILGHIEALRLRNAIRCPSDSTLIAQVAVDGQAVDFGEALFVIDSAEPPPVQQQAEPEPELVQALEPPRL